MYVNKEPNSTPLGLARIFGVRFMSDPANIVYCQPVQLFFFIIHCYTVFIIHLNTFLCMPLECSLSVLLCEVFDMDLNAGTFCVIIAQKLW